MSFGTRARSVRCSVPGCGCRGDCFLLDDLAKAQCQRLAPHYIG
jgi:hypothetical protein